MLPGSRRGEIQYIAPRLFAAAAEMSRRAARPALHRAGRPGLRHLIEPLRKQYAPDAPIALLDGRSHEALAACDVVLVASGTATLEATLYKRPMVVTYAMHALSWQMSKRMNYQPWVALPNILLRDFAVPELLQGDATPTKIAAAAFDWLDDPAAAPALRARFQGLHRDAAPRHRRAATDAIETVLAG